MSIAASMPPVEKKRNLADFFKPSVRARSFQETGSVVPQKRPSPSPDAENVPPPAKSEKPRTTPRKHSTVKTVKTPSRPNYSPISLPRSGSLPIRSPFPKSTLKPPYVYQDARLFGDVKFPSSPTSERRCSVPKKLKTPSPEQRQTKLDILGTSALPASTQAVVKGGKLVAVRDSDDDDDSSLASLDEIFGTRRDNDATSVSSPPELNEAKLESERRRTLSAFTYGRSEPLIGKDKLRSLYAKGRTKKLDISQLINDHLDEEEEEQKIQRSREQYDKSVQELGSGEHGAVDPKLLAALVQHAGGDEEEVARLVSAVSRTEALSSNKNFSFFESSEINDTSAGTPREVDFPQSSITSTLFRSYDDAGRTRAYLSGYMSELSGAGKLPDEVLNWTFDSVFTEKDDYLRQSYIKCLRQGSSTWTRTNLDAHRVEAIFLNLGATPSSLSNTIQTSYQSVNSKRSVVAKQLITTLDLFQAVCEDMDFLALTSLTAVVCRLMLDDSLMSNAAICVQVEKTLQALLNVTDREMRDHVFDCVLEDLTQHLDAPNLQAQLLSHIMPESLITCKLRTKLALTFLLGSDSAALEPSATASTILDALSNYIQTSPNFDTNTRTSPQQNYNLLRSRTHVLDIAISNGHRPGTFLTPVSEATFNASVDTLADALKAKYSSISDSGASHMQRMQAKDTLVAVSYRVLVAVRTKPRKKKHIFDGKGKLRVGEEVRVEERGRDFMKGFLAKVKEKGKGKEEGRGGEGVGSQGTEPMSSYASAMEELDGSCQ